MTPQSQIEEARKVLEDLKDISYYPNEDSEYGVYACCNNPDYKKHKPDCKRVRAITLALRILERMDERFIFNTLRNSEDCHREDCPDCNKNAQAILTAMVKED